MLLSELALVPVRVRDGLRLGLLIVIPTPIPDQLWLTAAQRLAAAAVTIGIPVVVQRAVVCGSRTHRWRGVAHATCAVVAGASAGGVWCTAPACTPAAAPTAASAVCTGCASAFVALAVLHGGTGLLAAAAAAERKEHVAYDRREHEYGHTDSNDEVLKRDPAHAADAAAVTTPPRRSLLRLVQRRLGRTLRR